MKKRPAPGPMTPVLVVGLILASIANLAAFGYWGAQLIGAGDQIPVHFGADGQPDRWGSPTESWIAWLILLITVILTLVLVKYPIVSNVPIEPTSEAAWQKIYYVIRLMLIAIGLSIGLMAFGIGGSVTSGGLGMLMYAGLLLLMVATIGGIVALVKIARAEQLRH